MILKDEDCLMQCMQTINEMGRLGTCFICKEVMHKLCYIHHMEDMSMVDTLHAEAYRGGSNAFRS